MFRRTFSKSFFTLALLLVAAAAVVAQNAPVRGRIEMKGADGKPVGVPNLVVDCYRTDINGKFPAAKTDKKGYFSFAGLPLGATFVFSISGPGISAEIYPNVKAGGGEDIIINVREGDGKSLTEAEVRERLKGAKAIAPTGEMTAEQKKEQEDYEKKVAEIKARNEKAQKANELINEALKAGSEAFSAKNWDLAIAKFEEGFQASPDYPGSAPVMLNNKSLALINRASELYNKAATADANARAAARETVKVDLSEVIVNSERVLKLLEGVAAPDPQAEKDYKENIYKALVSRKNGYRLLAQTGAEREKGKEALAAFQAYLAVELDPLKKSKAQLDLALTLQDSNLFDEAVVEFQKILETEPSNPDALVGIGLSLVNIGYINVDSDPAKGKQQLQDAANYLQRFVDVAPDTHKYKKDAVETIAQLKETQKVQPQKSKPAATPKKKP